MDKLKFETPDMVAGNIEKIGALFPAAVTEMRGEDGQIRKGINFEVLKQLLSRDVVDGDECYEFTWVGKKAAMAEAARPITKTLRPVKEDSRDWDTTQNLYIEGDNLEVLKILQESYLGKVKMIYIDPPYNTGHDFIYRDKFQRSQQEENEQMGMYDEDENQMFENTVSNGRFHSDWCSYVYGPLSLSRNLLAEDGVIFISIGQEEISNTLKICNELFGEENRLGIVSRQMKSGGGTQGKYFAHNVDYIVIYAKSYDVARYFRGEMSDDLVKKVYNQVEETGPRKGEFYRLMGLYQSSLGVRPGLRYYIQCPDGTFVIPPGSTFPSEKRPGCCVVPDATDGVWRWSYDLFQKELLAGNVAFKKSERGILLNSDGKLSDWNIYTKIWLKDRQEEGTIPSDLITKYENRHSSKELSTLKIPFPFSKPTGLIKWLMGIMQQENDMLVLDFFSGSATTADAVMQLNAEDGGHRKFIMVQLEEPCDETSEAFKAGYKNICEIGKERIRRAGDKIKEENPLGTQDLDIGFRVFRVDSSNMKDVYYQPEELDQQSLLELVSNIKDDRTDLDLLYACLLDWGVEIHLPHTSTDLDGCTIHNVDNGALMACFNPNVPTSVVEFMAKQQPLRAVFRDSAFASDDAKINVTEIFKNLSPDTKVKVI